MQTQTPAYTWPTIPLRPAHRPATGWVALFAALLAVAGCASAPRQTESMDYRARAETQVEGPVRVSAVALSPAESAASFGVPLAKENIQPVWLEIENGEDTDLFLSLLSVDPEYLAPSEVAWSFKGTGGRKFEDWIDTFVDRHLPLVAPPHSTVSGY
ncbi:MAG: hypothetical protein OEW88_12735, partial [Gammaproteobacteria bacterium]|nr:hypothetical protein [Gammaproteobacteria bacterium]